MELTKLTDTGYMTANGEFAIAEEESGDFWMVFTKDAEWLFSGPDLEACIKWLNENITEH